MNFNSNDDHNIYSTKYQFTLKGMMRFELISLYGRLFLNKKPKIQNGSSLLNLGCGSNILEGWVNADFYSGVKFWRKNTRRPAWMLDLRFPLKCDDNFWDGVFTEHTLEHLYPDQVLALLKELNRTMKKGAWLRISVPDLAKYVDYYSGKPVNHEFSIWPTGCEAIHSVTQTYAHVSAWDSKLLSRFLKEAGFANTHEVAFREGADVRLLKDSMERRWESLYLEAQQI